MGLTTEMADIEAVFLDLDGTIYLGSTLIEGASDFLSRLDERGIKRFFPVSYTHLTLPTRNCV